MRGAPERARSLRVRRPASTGEGRLVGAAASAAVTVLWLTLALLNPTTTYHFAPLIAAAASPVLRRAQTGRPLSGRETAVSTTGAAALVLVAAALLNWWDALRGPTLVGVGSAPVEAVVAIVVGGAIGAVAARWRGPGADSAPDGDRAPAPAARRPDEGGPRVPPAR